MLRISLQRFAQHDTAVYGMSYSHSWTPSVVRLLFLSLEERSLDELGQHWRHLKLDVPPLAHGTWLRHHVLAGERNFHGEPSELDHLSDPEADRDGPAIVVRRVPVREDVARVAHVPTPVEKQIRDRLDVDLVCVRTARVARVGPPLLGKHADDVLLGDVGEDGRWTGLPF